MLHFASFAEALLDAPQPSEGANTSTLYDWLIGDWEMDAVIYAEDGTRHQGRGEIHFARVLSGRAIQDVWILPGFFYGTTLRIYDANLGAWRILWSDPLKHYYARQIGRAHGGDIVQEGKTDQGALTRWSFTEITPASFRWRGEHSRDAGASWQLQADIHACRAASQGKFTRSQAMLDHVSIGVRDIARAKKFYDCALQPLGYGCLSEGESSLGYGADVVGFWVSAADSPVPSDPGSGLHICFRAPTRQSVDDFYAAARASGGADNGRPGLRADYGDNYYAAFVVDPDGYRLEAYCSAPVK